MQSVVGSKLRVTPTLCFVGVEMFKKELPQGEAGDNVGLLVRSVRRDDVRRGMVVCAPGTVKSHMSFEAQVNYTLLFLQYLQRIWFVGLRFEERRGRSSYPFC